MRRGVVVVVVVIVIIVVGGGDGFGVVAGVVVGELRRTGGWI